ncbi:MAG TPA: amidohydrolase family protein, partial [Granulicella sp.]
MTVESESSIVERDIQYLRDIERVEGLRPHLHVQHVSTAKALDAIRIAKKQGLHVTCEAAPHHFSLTDEAIGQPDASFYSTHFKMNPPLRSEHDRLAVIEGILDGTVDCIATDHAPHAAHEKQVEFDRAPNGITGLETSLGLALRVLHREHGLPLAKIATLMSTNPASLLKLSDRGNLREGSYADLVLFSPSAEWTFEARNSLSKSKNTPFDGSPMLGKVHATISEGRIVYSSGNADAPSIDYP